MWPFPRKPKSINPGPINEDWRVGDLAECVEQKGWSQDDTGQPIDGPEKGDILTVLEVEPRRTNLRGDGWYLGFAAYPMRFLAATGFRKVPPISTEASAEFTAKIKALRPAHRRTPA